ncbi:MAG: hypothetical protein QXZ66_05625 [Thermoproteota archaeon]
MARLLISHFISLSSGGINLYFSTFFSKKDVRAGLLKSLRDVQVVYATKRSLGV